MKTNAIRVNPVDNVAVAAREIKMGEPIAVANGETMTAKENIPASHKVALERIPEGQKILRYGEFIGLAAKNIEAGELVHTHNIKAKES